MTSFFLKILPLLKKVNWVVVEKVVRRVFTAVKEWRAKRAAKKAVKLASKEKHNEST